MGKNRKFRNVYTITVEGITTNGFAAKIYDDTLKAMVTAMDDQLVGNSVRIKVQTSEGDYNARTGETHE